MNSISSKEKNFLSAVVYAHNDADLIKEFLTKLIKIFESNFENSEIIVVNDFSTDNTKQKVKEASAIATGTTITLVNLSYFHGVELAMEAGDDLAIGDFVFEFDTAFVDYSDEIIMDTYGRCLEGYDIVSAAPQKKQKISSALFYSMLNTFSESNSCYVTERFKILSRRVLNRIGDMNRTVPYRKIVYANAGLQMDVLYYAINTKTKPKKDRLSQKYRKKLAIDTLILFTSVGYNFSLIMTFAMMIFAVLMAAYSIVVYIGSTPVEGWTTTVLFLSIAFFGLFGILTIVIKYLQIIMNLVFKRKQYSFEGIEKITR